MNLILQKQPIPKPSGPSGTHEEVIFDAQKDNNGKGISVNEMIRKLKKINHL
jgi:hypothetical protein